MAKKYIDADKLKAEIERQEKQCPLDTYEGRHKLFVLGGLKTFLSTLEESERPEPYNPVYDEAYLNEKIKKATESWKGVDVDAMLAECRGYDEEKSEEPDKSLEEAADEYSNENEYMEVGFCVEPIYIGHKTEKAFIAGAKWQAEKDKETIELAEEHAYFAGAVNEREQMMKGAVEGKVFMSFAPGHNQMVMADVDLPTNTKVKVIIVKED